MLSDAQIERWSRQILVPEVGGRGQTRLCTARVEVVGHDGPTALSAELVERAGPSVTVVGTASGNADVVVVWGAADAGLRSGPAGRGIPGGPSAGHLVFGAVHAARAVVTGVATAPCAACVALPTLPADDAPGDPALAHVTLRLAATLAASEVVRLLVVPSASRRTSRRTSGRTHHVDLIAGTFTAEAARAGVDCRVCGGPA